MGETRKPLIDLRRFGSLIDLYAYLLASRSAVPDLYIVDQPGHQPIIVIGYFSTMYAKAIVTWFSKEDAVDMAYQMIDAAREETFRAAHAESGRGDQP